MTNEFGGLDRYSNRLQNLSLREEERTAHGLSREERRLFGFTPDRLREEEKQFCPRDERGFEEEGD